jgi:TonB family protein
MKKCNAVWLLFMLTAFCLCVVQTLEAQELKTIEVKHPRYTGILERFHVLADQPEVKQGTYQKFIRKKLVETGSYAANKKEGIWKINDQKQQLVAEGVYKDDQKAGIWVYYSAAGVKLQMYDHDRDSMIYFDVEEERKRAYAPAMFPDTSGERMPLFIGGNYYMMVMIENNLIFPEAGWKRGRDTKVVVSFSVDAEGHTTDVKSLSQAGYGFDEEAVRLIQLLGNNWIPGFTKGKFVKVGFTLPVTFKFI